jgi:hypothetical protein
MRDRQTASTLVNVPIDTRVQLSALWTATMFCYIYCDYFALYIPGKLEGMMRGEMGPLGAVTQGTLVGTSLLMAVPSLMIALSVVLPARPSRSLNIIVGAFYALLLALFASTATWYFYKLFAGLEAILAALIVARAWRWPAH